MSRKAPLIGITTSTRTVVSERSGARIEVESFASPCAFSELVRECGGIPFMLPSLDDKALIDEYLNLLDGILFSGGNDINPKVRGGEPNPASAYDDRKDSFEPDLIDGAIERDMPLLCVCRGHQLLNLTCGGTLWQDVPHVDHHQQKGDGLVLRHPIRITEKDSIMGRIAAGDEMVVNSFHHQGIRDLAPGLRVTGVHEDGMIECVEMPDKRFVLGIQFHPEFLNPEEKEGRIDVVRAFMDAVRDAMA